MRRPSQTFCKSLLLSVLLASIPASAQQTPGLKTRVERHSPNHTTIVIHDTRPQAHVRQNNAAARAHEAREAERQRQHEVELAKIEAEARVRVARAQNIVAQPAPVPPVSSQEEKKPSYRNGGQFTGFSNSFFVGGYGGYGGYGYGGGFGGYPYGGGFGPPAYPIRSCAPVYRRCR